MDIIKLPAIFNSNNDLTIINQKLRNSTAQLDWSSVISITESQLEILLDGISEDDFKFEWGYSRLYFKLDRPLF